MKSLVRIGVLGITALLIYMFYQPGIPDLLEQNPKSTALIELRKEQARKAKVSYSTSMIWRDLDQISPHLIHAVLLSEDDRFYHHHGFALKEMWEAVKTNWREKRYAYGGSTLSQQLARTLFLSPKKNLLRKSKEAVITYRLERTLPKKRILELYMNVVEWGRGIYGAEAAARSYYGKAARDLTPDEAVALASILPSPRRWSPMGEQGFMARRRTRLLQRMQRAGYVPAAPYEGVFDPALPTPEPVAHPDELHGEYIHIAPENP